MMENLLELREQVMDRADRALDAAWPARLGDEYVREMRRAVGELEMIANEMQAKGFNRVEQSRTYRFLGSVYADLEPALGKEMLIKAKGAYRKAETLLEGQSNELERAKLNFNFANTLRQIDPNDMDQLQEAKRRLLDARACFASDAPQYLAKVDEALKSVESLLKIAPVASAVKRNIDDMAALQENLATRGSISEMAEKAQEVMKRGGGAAGLIGQVQAIIDGLSDEQKRSDKFKDIQKQMKGLTRKVIGNDEMSPEVKQIWTLLRDRLKSDLAGNVVSRERADSLSGILEEFGRVLSGDEKDIEALLSKSQRMREFINSRFEMAHYLSHGIERPPANSRAADLVELNWQLRRYILEEMNRREKCEEESKEALDLNLRSSRVDKRIYEAEADNKQAMIVEREDLRPLALSIRRFSARMNSMPARPIWRVANLAVDTNAVFYSGAAKDKQSIASACSSLGLEIMEEPAGKSYAGARWQQLQKALTAVFDIRTTEGPDMASINYELGIALALGKPIVILIAKGQTLPFDVDIDPIILSGGQQDIFAIAVAIDQSIVWTCPRPQSDSSLKTLEYILSLYTRPHQNIYVDQTLRMLDNFRKTPDPLAISRALVKLFDYLNDGETMIIHPRWSPVYSNPNELRLFHVMPFRPKWADKVRDITRKLCESVNINYIRGDEMAEPNVIYSIWEEIARATHVLVDITGFNPNVALELGIAHTLGKNVMIVGQGDPDEYVFQSISKLRVYGYNLKNLQDTFGKEVRKFILSK